MTDVVDSSFAMIGLDNVQAAVLRLQNINDVLVHTERVSSDTQRTHALECSAVFRFRRFCRRTSVARQACNCYFPTTAAAPLRAIRLRSASLRSRVLSSRNEQASILALRSEQAVKSAPVQQVPMAAQSQPNTRRCSSLICTRYELGQR